MARKLTTADKRAALDKVRAMIAPDYPGGPLPLLAALARVQVAPATFYRWCDAEVSGAWDRESQPAGGRPARFTADTSRSAVADTGFKLTASEVACLRWFALNHESAGFGIVKFASYVDASQYVNPDGTRRCPHDPPRECVRAAIMVDINAARAGGRRYHPPLSLMRLATVTNADKAQHRSRRAALPCQLSVPKSMTWRAEDGTVFDLLPGTLYVADDHDCNNPAMQRDIDGKIKGVRQNVAVMDAVSLTWLYNGAIARKDNAYRLEDQAEIVERVIALNGWCKGFIIERGPWDNNLWFGTPLPSSWGEPDGAVWGGLGARMHILPQHKPNGKSEIEQGFNRLQKIMAQMCVDVGRRRGEFEKATRLVKRAQEGDPAALRQFWTLSAQADAIAAAMLEDSTTPHARTALGGKMVTPLDWWQSEAVTEPLLPSERHLFCPLQVPRSVRKDGTVRYTDADYDRTFVFSVSGVFRGCQELDWGHRLFVSFHPGRTDRGAYIFNGERATARNRDGLRYGEFLGIAPCVESVPRVVVARSGDDDYSLPKKRSAAIAAEYRSIVPARNGGAGDNFGVRRHSAERTDIVNRTAPDADSPTESLTVQRNGRVVESPPREGRGGIAALLRQHRGMKPAPDAVAETTLSGTAG